MEAAAETSAAAAVGVAEPAVVAADDVSLTDNEKEAIATARRDAPPLCFCY